jgi:glycosyltransferase involved in cell wall biosynthesis
MRIGIDCRMYGLKNAGIGRYVLNLVENLLPLDDENEYVLFVCQDFEGEAKNQSASWRKKVKIVVADIRHYSLQEQLLLPFILYREKLDLVHFPHFNVPVLYFKKFVVTIHDLIKHTSKGVETTTRSPWVYWLKYLGYKIVFWLTVKRAERIMVPCQAVKNDLRQEYGLDSQKVRVTYEGFDSNIKNSSNTTAILEKYKIKKPYLLYVGSVYPHKNIERLIDAIKLLVTDYQLPVTLVVVCARSVFWERLKEKVVQLKAEDLVNLAGFVPDSELGALYRQAGAFVFPSLSEGFGLPGLEAMAQGVAVAASDIPVFKEVYKDAAVYFEPEDPEDIADKIKKLLSDKKLQEQLKEQGSRLVKQYSWKKMAQETLQVYNFSLR